MKKQDKSVKIQNAKDYLEERNYQKMLKNQESKLKRTASADEFRDKRDSSTKKRSTSSRDLKLPDRKKSDTNKFLIKIGSEMSLTGTSKRKVKRP